MRTITDRRFDFSGGVQSASSWLLRAPNEIEDVTNGRFNDEVGRIARRLGYVAIGDTVVNGKPGLGLFEAKFSTGAVVFAATNKGDDTATEIRKRNSNGTWTLLSMPTALAVNTEINMCTSLDSAYIAGKAASGARMKIVNVKNDLTLSETRNLIGAPRARFICEYGGRLHAINVELNGTTYPDRDYISSPALSTITFTRAVITLADNSMLVDSARYLKAGMAIDIYNHVTGAARYSNLTIASVDKATDAIVLPANPNNLTFGTGAVNTSTDVITLSSTTNYPTGTAVTISSTSAVPGGLTVNTVYYVINTSSTTIKLATSAANATAGTAIDLTSTGAGTMTANISYITADNDEIYLTGRYGELYYLWNTDYPTADKADFLKIPSGASANSEIIGYAKSNNRLFLYTDTTLHRYDQSQLIPIFEDIGCANHQTIRNIGDWLIWLDNDKRVVARNDSTGQMEFISRSIKKKYLRDVPLANLANAAAGAIDNVYKLSLGTVNGKALRVVYDFDSNNWSRDEYIREFRRHIVSSAVGSSKSMYMLTDQGKFVQDETGNDDDGDDIPLVIKYGRQHYGTAAEKNLVGMYVFGENLAGGEVRVYKNGDTQSPTVIGKLDGNISVVTPGQRDVAGRDLNIEIAISAKGDPPAVDGHEVHLTTQEDKFDGTK
jgi:hypothetical protein